MKRTSTATRISHDQKVIDRLKNDASFAAEYFKAAMEADDEPKVLLTALRRIAEARGDISQNARK